MKIRKLKINSYGKLKEKEINLKDNINIIYGKNEAGKSTLLKFITNSFYGISKNKKGKEFSDYEKYLPWSGDEFSGKIEYELDNNETYEVFRDFKKKNPIIFNKNMEDISKQFNIDKNKGNEFFYEQTKVDEELFLSTIVTNQEEVKLGKQEQNFLIQKIANLVGTGDDNVSFKRAIDRINRRQLDEVGTERSREKPINVVGNEIRKLQFEKQELEKYNNIKYEIEENKNKLESEIQVLEKNNNFLRQIKLLMENEKIENEKIKIKQELENENNEKIKILKNKLNDLEKNIKNEDENNIEKNKKKINIEKNKLNKKIILFSILVIIFNILQFIFIPNLILKCILLLTVPALLIYFIFNKNKLNKKIQVLKENEKNNLIYLEKINFELDALKKEINISEENNEKIKEEINNLKNNLHLKINIEKEKISKNNYTEYEINKYNNLESVNFELENTQNKLNNKKIELHTLNLDRKNIEPKLNNLSEIEEKLVNNNEKMSTLFKINSSMNLAKEVLFNSYEEMKKSVTPKFTQELSKNIAQITNNKYSNVRFHDDIGLVVELDSGNYVTASKLSVGTIDQLYLSLRLSMVEDMSDEKMPIILDESFAYYDSQRLENILRYISDKFKEHQIILFTCTNREKEILENLDIEYNLINL